MNLPASADGTKTHSTPQAVVHQRDEEVSIRRLVVIGYVVLAVALSATIAVGAYSISRVSDGFASIDRAWGHADAVMEMNIAAHKANWALALADQGAYQQARKAQRESLQMFETQLAHVQASGVMSAELSESYSLYKQLQQRVSARLAAVDPAQVFNVREVEMQAELDELMADMESRGDTQMDGATSIVREDVTSLVRGVVIGSAAWIVIWAALGLFIGRRMLGGLGRSIGRIVSATEQLAGAASHQIDNVSAQNDVTTQISTTMQQLQGSCDDMTDKSEMMVQISRAAEEECRKGHTYLSNSQQGMGEIKQEVERITDHMRTLEEKSHQISGVLEIINDMASQTNLLSINATIEAAGAGEAGRRFAVVAEEIRLLAERAVESTDEIRALIDDIQETARVTFNATADGAQAVDRGLADSNNIANNFNALIALVTQTAEAVQSIESTAREQGMAVTQVTDAITSLSDMSSESERHFGDTLETIQGLSNLSRTLEGMAGRQTSGEDRQ